MSDEIETEETVDELPEAVETSFSIDGWNYRATYASDGVVGQLRVYLDDEEIVDAGDRWSRAAPTFDAETLEETAREGLKRVYSAVGAPMARGDAFAAELRERFAPAPTPGDPGEETTVRSTATIDLDDGRQLALTWAESTDGSVGVATATHNGRHAFDDIWRDGTAGPTWDAADLDAWARERASAGC